MHVLLPVALPPIDLSDPSSAGIHARHVEKELGNKVVRLEIRILLGF